MRFLVRSVSVHYTFFPKCSECIYFEPRDVKCRRFGEIDKEKRVTYEYADLCRKNHQCGPVGKYFEQK
jgi:hypothetical protein